MISKKTKYAINALVYLAKINPSKPVLIQKIAADQNIPQKFLEAILLDLKKAGILNSKKGRGGGYFLVQSPDEVNLAEIMRLIDGPIALLPCVTYKYYQQCEECIDETTCGIRKVFMEVRNKTVNTLKKASLSEIIKKEKSTENKSLPI